MKRRNQFLKYKMQQIEGDGAGGQGGGGGGGGGDGAGDTSAENNNTDFSTIWHNPQQNKGDNNQQQQQPAQMQQQQQSSPQDVFAQHMQSLDFGTDGSSLMEAMQSNDPAKMVEAARNWQEGMYRTTMMQVNKLVSQQMDAVRKEADANASSTVESNKMMEQLHSSLPFTQQPAYAPMAQAVFTQLLDQDGMTTQKAIEETGKYFQGMANDVAKTMQSAPNGKPGGGFGNSIPQFGGDNGDSETEVNWVELLGGKPDGN